MIDLLNGFVNLLTNVEAVLFVFLAAFVGIVAGALPGLTASAAIAIDQEFLKIPARNFYY